MKFVNQFIFYIVKTLHLDKSKTGLSIGGGDLAHEFVLDKYTNVFVLNDIDYYNAEKDSLPYNNNHFDFVFIKSVIEHIRNTDLFLSEIYRVLKKDGIVIIFAPDYQKQKDWFYDDYTHIKPFTLEGLKMAVMLNGFTIQIARWFWYYKAIWEGKMLPNVLPCRFALWLTKKTKIKWFRWGSDRQLFVVGRK